MPGSPEPSRVRSLRGALQLLRRPPAPQAVRFKPIVDAGDRCRIAAYTDVRFVIDQLNAVAGARWSAAYEELPTSHRSTVAEDGAQMLYVRCALTVFDVVRTDVGEGRDGSAHGAGPKAAYSDALKRAAVHFGVNQAIYAMRAPWLAVHEGRGRCPPGLVSRSQRGHLFVPDATLERLRASYAAWLKGRGATFGAPIDFGEQDGALGLDGEPAMSATAESENGATTRPVAPVASARVVRLGAASAATLRAASHPLRYPATLSALRAQAVRAGLDERATGRLAELICGEDLLDRLPAARVIELTRVLEAARATGLTGMDLRIAVDAAAAHPDRAAARSALLSQLSRTG